MLSTTYAVDCLAIGVPALLGGVGVDYGDGLFVTARAYGSAVIVRAVFALVVTLLKRPALPPVPAWTRKARAGAGRS